MLLEAKKSERERMNTNQKYKRILKSGASALIIGIEVGIYWILWELYFNKILGSPFWRRGIWLIVLFYAILLLFFNFTYGGLKIGYLKRGNIIFSHTFSLIIVNTLSYLQLALIDKKFHNPWVYVIMTLVEFLIVVAWVFFFQWIYSLMFPPRTLLIVYGEKPVFSIMEKINSRDDKYIIAGAIKIGKGTEKIMEEAVRFGGLVIGDISSHDRNILLKRCYELGIRAYMIPKISDILIRSSGELNLFDTQILLSRDEVLSLDQAMVKRLLDIVLSGLMLIFTLPLFLIFAIAIKLDGGPVFYKQKRLTLNGKVFEILKFRTMITNAEKDGKARLAGKKDSRITRIGSFLRASRLDELPQLINILAGDMSLVGPRPERPEIASEYEKEIPEFHFRLKMKAGLTGYAQIYGKYNTTAYDKLKLDLSYIRQYSIWLDLKLILMTPKILFIKESTEGVSDSSVLTVQDKKKLKEEAFGKAKEWI